MLGAGPRRLRTSASQHPPPPPPRKAATQHGYGINSLQRTVLIVDNLGQDFGELTGRVAEEKREVSQRIAVLSATQERLATAYGRLQNQRILDQQEQQRLRAECEKNALLHEQRVEQRCSSNEVKVVTLAQTTARRFAKNAETFRLLHEDVSSTKEQVEIHGRWLQLRREVEERRFGK